MPAKPAPSPPPPHSGVVYDIERPHPVSPLSSPLAPPDMDYILSSRRPLYHRLLHFRLPGRAQTIVTCACIVLSAVQANGVYVWPTYGPVVAKRLELGGPEAQTIVVGGILGVYLMAAPLGSVTDRHGPRIGSLISAGLSAAGYFSFALILEKANPDTPYVHLWLTLAYFLIGGATVGSYFAALTCASLSFPSHPTLSLSVPLSLISLSSLVLSSFSSLNIFQSPIGDLNPVSYLTFLGILSLVLNLLSALFLRILPTKLPGLQDDTEHDHGRESTEEEEDICSPTSQLLHLDEHTPLLIGGPEAAREDAEAIVRGKERWTVGRLLVDWGGFWAFGILLALCIGPSETIIASIGTILTSLLPPSDPAPTTHILTSTPASSLPSFSFLSLSPLSLSALSDTSASHPLLLRNKHVQILSLTGTVSRLLTGLVADWLAPPLTPVAIPHGPGQNDLNASVHIYVQRRPVRLLRTSFNALGALALAGVFAWSAGWLESESGLWVLSAGTGLMYGTLFTLTPAIVSAHFGPTSFGLAWGMISYFAAFGAVGFSYLYAFISSAVASIPNHSPIPGAPGESGFISHREDQIPTCYGTRCFSATLWIAAGCCVISGLGMFGIGRRWKV